VGVSATTWKERNVKEGMIEEGGLRNGQRLEGRKEGEVETKRWKGNQGRLRM
jgi:hypothetical protein